MFKELMNFKYKRTGVQAIGFYIVFFIICVLLGGILSALLQINSTADPKVIYENGLRIGSCTAIVYCATLSLTILVVKKLYKSALAIILFLLTFVGAILMGGLLGCIFPAILSTFEVKD